MHDESRSQGKGRAAPRGTNGSVELEEPARCAHSVRADTAHGLQRVGEKPVQVPA